VAREPTLILVGSFLVRVTMVAFALSRRYEHHLTARRRCCSASSAAERRYGEPAAG
jgi:hypothetical protein